MATFKGNGTGTIGASSYTLMLDVWEDSYNTSENYSIVKGNLYLISTTYNFYQTVMSTCLYIDNVSIFYDTSQIGIDSNTKKLITSFEQKVYHDTNGKKTVNFYASMNNTSQYYLPGSINCSGPLVLTDIHLKPVVSISKVANTATTITIKCVDTNNIKSEKYCVYNGDTFLKESVENVIVLENLEPNTRYNIKAYGYHSGKLGVESNTLYITTSSKAIIEKINSATLDCINMEISDISGDNSLVILVGNKEVARRNNITNGEYEILFTSEEKQLIYERIGNSENKKITVKVETGGEISQVETDITLTGDVFCCYVNVNGILKRGKIWIGTNKGNKQGILVIGTNRGNIRGK